MSTTQLSRAPSPPVSVRFVGELDIASVETVARALAAAIAATDGDLVVDLGQVTFLDARIAGLFERTRLYLGERSATLRLLAPTPFVGRVLDICGLGDLVEAGNLPTEPARADPGLAVLRLPTTSWCSNRAGMAAAPVLGA